MISGPESESESDPSSAGGTGFAAAAAARDGRFAKNDMRVPFVAVGVADALGDAAASAADAFATVPGAAVVDRWTRFGRGLLLLLLLLLLLRLPPFLPPVLLRFVPRPPKNEVIDPLAWSTWTEQSFPWYCTLFILLLTLCH